MYSNFWKPIRSWFLITYLNSFKQHCYFSEMEYLQFPPPYLHCILSTLSALWGWSAGLGQWGIGGLEGSKILVTLCPSLGMASGWLPPSMENHFNYYMPFFFNYYMSFSFWILLNCSLPLSLKDTALSLVIFLHSAHTLVNNSSTKSSSDYFNVSSFPW